MQIFEERATTAIYVRIKRYQETHFILVDEYETVDALKGRLLNALEVIGFKLDPRGEEQMTIEDIKLYNKRRVSVHNCSCNLHFLFSNLMALQLATISRSSITQSCGFCSENQAPKTTGTI